MQKDHGEFKPSEDQEPPADDVDPPNGAYDLVNAIHLFQEAGRMDVRTSPVHILSTVHIEPVAAKFGAIEVSKVTHVVQDGATEVKHSFRLFVFIQDCSFTCPLPALYFGEQRILLQSPFANLEVWAAGVVGVWKEERELFSGLSNGILIVIEVDAGFASFREPQVHESIAIL